MNKRPRKLKLSDGTWRYVAKSHMDDEEWKWHYSVRLWTPAGRNFLLKSEDVEQCLVAIPGQNHMAITPGALRRFIELNRDRL